MNKITKSEANHLVLQARATAEKTLKEIINRRAWLVLGYATFTDLYRSEFSECQLATEILPTVVYALLDAQATDAEIVDTVQGVTYKKVKVIRTQKNLGVGKDSVTVREHGRKKPQKKWASAEISGELSDEINAAAEAYSMTRQDFIVEAIEYHLATYGQAVA